MNTANINVKADPDTKEYHKAMADDTVSPESVH